MPRTAQDRIQEIKSLLGSALANVLGLKALAGIDDPFRNLAKSANIHDFLKRAQIEVDWLSKYYSRQMKRKGAHK
jgi:hypothetical protein